MLFSMGLPLNIRRMAGSMSEKFGSGPARPTPIAAQVLCEQAAHVNGKYSHIFSLNQCVISAVLFYRYIIHCFTA
jgi:hypothetical protein